MLQEETPQDGDQVLKTRGDSEWVRRATKIELGSRTPQMLIAQIAVVMEYDKNTGHFYYFNTQTSESRWAEEYQAGGSFSIDSTEPSDRRHGSTSASASCDAKRHTAAPGPTGSGWLKRRGGKQMSPESAEEDDEDTTPRDQEPEEPHVEMLETSRKGAEVYRRTQPVVIAFTAMFYFHGCCCEGPMAAIEGLVRSPLYLIVSSLLLLRAILTRRRMHFVQALRWLREGCLMLSATITLLVPGAALSVYRKFGSDEDEWDVAGIPTCLGSVDPRRFYVFSHGQGSMAANGFYDSDVGSIDTLGKSILHPPRTLVISRSLSASEKGGALDENGEPRLERRVQLTEQGKAYQQV